MDIRKAVRFSRFSELSLISRSEFGVLLPSSSVALVRAIGLSLAWGLSGAGFGEVLRLKANSLGAGPVGILFDRLGLGLSRAHCRLALDSGLGALAEKALERVL